MQAVAQRSARQLLLRAVPRPFRGRQQLSAMAQARRVPPTEAAELVYKQGYKYVDVRTPQEFAAGHPRDAVNIPFMLSTPDGMKPNPDFLQSWQEAFPDAAAPLVVGCKAGNRSARACTLLSEQEQYSGLVDNAGGYDGWVADDLPRSNFVVGNSE